MSETISVHNMFSPGFSLEFSCIELEIQWTICRLYWCRNNRFWQRFTCTYFLLLKRIVLFWRITIEKRTLGKFVHNSTKECILFLQNLIFTDIYKWEISFLHSPTRLSISEKSATYTIKWSYTIIWQVRVFLTYFLFSFQTEYYSKIDTRVRTL